MAWTVRSERDREFLTYLETYILCNPSYTTLYRMRDAHHPFRTMRNLNGDLLDNLARPSLHGGAYPACRDFKRNVPKLI